jgi:GDP-4-dehydro-6-deoxy-D-mannose reductase
VLITGAAGFVGQHLAEHLHAAGYQQVHGTSIAAAPDLAAVIGESNVHIVDLSQPEAVFALLQTVKPDWIFHLAAMADVGGSFDRALHVMQTNTALQFIMLEGLRLHCPQARLLSVSSAYVYGLLPAEYQGRPISEDAPLRPNNPYAVSKVTQDMLALSYHLSYHLDIVRVRPFNQIGPRQAPGFVVTDFARQIIKIERGEQTEMRVGNLDAIRDFTDVRDAVRAYELLLRFGAAGDVYNLGSGRATSVQAILDGLIVSAQVPIATVADPKLIRPVDVPMFVADNRKMRRLGWEPRIPLTQTLQDVISYERTSGHSGRKEEKKKI